jgi:FAD-linked sulfhydryl oxidase
MAAYFPEAPSPEEQAAARGLASALALLYPCQHCRAAFAVALEEDPVDVRSRAALSAWACRHHNRVNEALGKPAFACSEGALQRRWRTGCAAGGVPPLNEP